MSYKFYDSSPYICAAGKVFKKDNLKDELTAFPAYEYANHYLKTAEKENRFQKILNSGVIPKIPPKSESDTVQKSIEPDLNKSRFEEFEEEFYEDLYYHSAKAGRAGFRARIGSKPDDVTNTSQKFGKITERSESAYGIILPNKKPEEVKKEQEFFHDKYIISHNSYFPSEKIKRYSQNSFNPAGKTFGSYHNHDTSGKVIKNVLTDCNIGKTVILSTIQDDCNKRSKSMLGKGIKKQGLNHSVGECYGSHPKIDVCTVRSIMQNEPSCNDLRSVLEAISYISNLRIKLKNKFGFSLTTVEIALNNFDPDNTFYLDWELVFKVLTTFSGNVNKEKIKLVANYFKIVNDDDKVNYVEFLKLFDRSIPLPKLGNLVNSPSIDPDLCTTYREFASDSKHTTCYPTNIPAGLIISSKPMIPAGFCKADLNSLCDETDAKTCISPSIACQLGLSHRDYLLPRSKDEIRRIFRNCLRDIDDKKFNNLYEEALKLPTSICDKVSVEAFKCCLIKFRKEQNIKVITL